MKKWLSLFSALALTIVMCIGMGIALPVAAESEEMLVIDLSKFPADGGEYRILYNQLGAAGTEYDGQSNSYTVSCKYYIDTEATNLSIQLGMTNWAGNYAAENMNKLREETTLTFTKTFTGNWICLSIGHSSAEPIRLKNSDAKVYIWDLSVTVGDSTENILDKDGDKYALSAVDGWKGVNGWIGYGKVIPQGYVYKDDLANAPFKQESDDDNDESDTPEAEAAPMMVLDLSKFPEGGNHNYRILYNPLYDASNTAHPGKYTVTCDYYLDAPADVTGIDMGFLWWNGVIGTAKMSEKGKVSKFEYSTNISASQTWPNLIFGNNNTTDGRVLTQKNAKLYVWNLKVTCDDGTNVTDVLANDGDAYQLSSSFGWTGITDGWMAYSVGGNSFPEGIYIDTVDNLPAEATLPPALIVDLTANNGQSDVRNTVIYNMLRGIDAAGKKVTATFNYYYDTDLEKPIRVGLDDMGLTNVDSDAFLNVYRQETSFSYTWTVNTSRTEEDLMFRFGRSDVDGFLNDKSGKLYIWNLSITVEGDDTNWIKDAYQYNGTEYLNANSGGYENWHYDYPEGWMAYRYRSSNHSSWLYFGNTGNVPSRKVIETNETLEIGAAGFYNGLIEKNGANTAALRYYFGLTTNFDGEKETITVGANTYTVKDIRALLVTNARLAALEREDVTVDMIDNTRVLDVDITTFRAEDVDDEAGTKTYSFSVLLTNISKANVAKDVTARAYLVCEDADGNTVYVYGESQYTSVQEMYEVAVEVGDAINAEFAAWMA